MEEDDDDFEDLFSFGAPTPVIPSERTKTPTISFSHDEILNDVVTPGAIAAHVPGVGVGALLLDLRPLCLAWPPGQPQPLTPLPSCPFIR